MSTKTTFKRIALVAVAALGFGTLSVAPSNAYATLWGISAVTPSNTGTTNVAVKSLVAVNFTGTTTGEINISGATVISTPAGSAITCSSLSYSANTNTAYTNTNVTLGNQAGASGTSSVWYTADECATNNTAGGGNYVNGAQIKGTAAGYTQAYFNIGFTPDKAGKYVVRVYAAPMATKDAFYTDLTFTVTDPVVQSIKAYLNTDSSTALTADASSLSYAAAAAVTAKGALTVQQYSTTDTTTVATTAISQAVTVTISKGLVSKTNDYFAGAKSVTTAAAGSTNGLSTYYVFANGEVGTATLTVTVGALTSTKTITFQGVAATLSAALTTGQPTFIAPSGTTTLTVTAKDSAGNAAVALPTLTVTSATTTVATATIASGVVTITGVAAGTSVITIADSATTAPATSATYTVTVAPAASATLPTITFDKAEYLAGELMTITIAAQAADNASFVAFTGLPTVSVNVITTTNPFSGGNTGTVALVGGKATWKAYAPITPGPVVITATSSTGSSATAAAVTATATVISDGIAQAAVDAAAEAIDAANAATDAANAAAEAADAATAAAQDAADAVAALSVSVAAMIDSLKKQITALTNLVIKIQKKVKA